ncbi:hypothetical protein V2I01_32540 [Micromonospora sp. BRA006-A]|nr:hypothetical protein [Micromonospora sp. BRA006-A]
MADRARRAAGRRRTRARDRGAAPRRRLARPVRVVPRAAHRGTGPGAAPLRPARRPRGDLGVGAHRGRRQRAEMYRIAGPDGPSANVGPAVVGQR